MKDWLLVLTPFALSLGVLVLLLFGLFHGT
jgi:hypothetical protein